MFTTECIAAFTDENIISTVKVLSATQ